VGVLDRLARVDAQLVAQQDPEAFIGGKRLGREPFPPWSCRRLGGRAAANIRQTTGFPALVVDS
jgi:hypothetical protein